MKKKNSDIFQQALGEATHKPTDNWEKELDKAKQTKIKRMSKEELIREIISTQQGALFDTKSLRRNDVKTLMLIRRLLRNLRFPWE
ncbi:MAG: hypothetical protein MK218_05430 [Gammaproteobacteria bacterium]|jgi:hypothetical protein|nr:hypothetical protein [Gammaproteobacteria bacterium]